MPDGGDRPAAATLDDVFAEIRALRAEVREALAARPPLNPAIGAYLRAVDANWGNGAYRCAELLAWAGNPSFIDRAAVLAAAKTLCGAPPTAHLLGLRLHAIAGVVVDGLKLERVAARERGARLWAVVSVRG